jgi:hypothetical protein
MFDSCTKIKKRIIVWVSYAKVLLMNPVQLPQFHTRPECSVGVMTLDDAWLLITQGWLTIEGAQYLFPKEAWEFLPQSKPLLPCAKSTFPRAKRRPRVSRAVA